MGCKLFYRMPDEFAHSLCSELLEVEGNACYLLNSPQRLFGLDTRLIDRVLGWVELLFEFAPFGRCCSLLFQ